jgi:hypothetical protein
MIIIGSHWFVQMALAVFMFQADHRINAVRITIFISGFLAIVFVIISFMSFLIGGPQRPVHWAGIVPLLSPSLPPSFSSPHSLGHSHSFIDSLFTSIGYVH